MLDAVVRATPSETDPSAIVQELEPILLSLYQHIKDLSNIIRRRKEELKVFKLERVRRLTNSMRHTGLNLPYLPVPFQDGSFPNIAIQSLTDIGSLSEEQVQCLLKGYGITSGPESESLPYQKQRLAWALGLDPERISQLANS